MKSPHISAALATYNEEQNIQDCVESLKKIADEVVVVDGTSTDRTAEIAKKAGARVIKTTNKAMFHINKNKAIDACKGDWIYLADADERISDELAKEIKQIVSENPKENGFWVPRANWFLGGFLKKGGAYPDSVIRLFRRGKGRLPEVTVHEQVKIDGDVGNLNHDILHLADPNFSRYLMRANRYTEETASNLKKQNVGKDTLTMVYYTAIKPILIFLKLYFRHRGYKDGFRGFIWAFFSGFHYFFAYVKYAKSKAQ